MGRGGAGRPDDSCKANSTSVMADRVVLDHRGIRSRVQQRETGACAGCIPSEVMHVGRSLAQYTHCTPVDDLPLLSYMRVKRRLLDSLGCAFGAWNAPPCSIARKLAQSANIPTGATLAQSAQNPAGLATFANGAMVRYLDFNDTVPGQGTGSSLRQYPGRHRGGRNSPRFRARVIQSIALAYEIQCRLCDAAALRPKGGTMSPTAPSRRRSARPKVMKLTGGAGAPGHQPGRSGEHRPATNQSRRPLDVEGLRVFQRRTQRPVCCAAGSSRHDRPCRSFEGEKGFMKVVSGSFELPRLGGRPGPWTVASTPV